ncbi:MAG: glycosyltransferase [Microbacterium sp.]|uniref:glycosyltransferase n=1 Tax=Microbacterium sp. TaxID=51671 RepID=UPI0039E45AD2
MTGELPDASYLLLASRLVPGLDGGFTVSVLRRAADIAAATGEFPLLLTVDLGGEHDADRAEWQRRGMLPDPARLRNLFDDARADPSWLIAAVSPAAGVSQLRLDAAEATPQEGPADPRAELRHGRRLIADAAGAPVLELPYGGEAATWHLTDEPVTVFDGGAPVGRLRGYRELYRVWIDHVVAAERARRERPAVLVCESRQIGELLVDDGAGRPRPDVPILHTTHACHLEPPYTPDAPIQPAWERWLRVADRFEAVLWLTPTQRDDVARRIDGIRSFVVPHPAPSPATDAMVEPGRVVIRGTLIPRKRVDHAVRAVARVPGARLAVYGDGPERAAVADLAARLDADVELAGHVADPESGWQDADVLVLTSTSEGQPLVVLEALAHGVPVVSYDMPYGPRDTLAAGGGVLVPSGDGEALAAAVAGIVGDRERRAALSAEALASAARMDAASSMRAFGVAVRAAL